MRNLLSMVALLGILPAAAGAQTAVGTVTAQAKVQSAVTFQTVVSALDFGTIVPGTAVSVTPAAGNGSGIIPIRYNTPAAITVGSLTLTHSSLPVTITPSLLCGQAQSAAAASPTTFTCSSGFSTALVSNAQTTWHVYVGGTITGVQTSTIAAGVYTGSVTLTATFTTY